MEEDEDEDEETGFMSSYSDALNQQLKSTTLDKSFVRASEPPLNKDEVSVHTQKTSLCDNIMLRMTFVLFF